MSIDTLLGGLSAEEFLRDYWQKKPLLVRGALPDFQCPVTPEELGGLALEEDAESRIIIEKDGEHPWQVKHGPFAEEDFTSLPATHWTVLVQEINKHVPEFALLQDCFNFLPNWRLDDVMVSFAPDQGTVGPHADNYDVFLIQGPGRRRWQLSYQDAGPDQLIPELPLRILKDFRPEEEYILEEGDMLYLPPGVVHHGVALGDCITISVGFRAPAVAELTAAFCADAVGRIDTERFYGDPDIEARETPGLITDGELSKLRAELREALSRDDTALDRWFAHFITDIKPGHELPEPLLPLRPREMREAIEVQGRLWRSEYARFSYILQNGQTVLYAAGEEYALPEKLAFAAPLLSGQRVFTAAELSPHLANEEFVDLLCHLYNAGCLYFLMDDDGDG